MEYRQTADDRQTDKMFAVSISSVESYMKSACVTFKLCWNVWIWNCHCMLQFAEAAVVASIERCVWSLAEEHRFAVTDTNSALCMT